MAWNKQIKFLIKTDADWTSQNPVIPSGGIVFVDIGDGNYRIKIGTGNNYVDTKFTDEDLLSGKLDKGTEPDLVVFDDGSRGIIDTLSIQDIIDAGYHLVTDAEWENLKLYSIAPPSFTATPGFSSAIKEIGQSISGDYSFSLSKTNNSNFKETTGGNIAVNQGTWSGLGDFDLKSNSNLTITATSFTLNSAGTVVFTLYGRDIYDQQVSLQTFSIEYQYPIWGGVRFNTGIVDENSLSNLVKKVAKTVDGLEFTLDAGGSLQYYHLLVPTEIASNLDIRDSSSPGPGSGNMVLQSTVTLSVGSITKSYNHYVSNFQSAGKITLILKVTS